MNVISDLTRDIRPDLEEILIDSIYDTIESDRKRESFDGPYVKHENDTFYYRVVYLFMQRAVVFYTNEEISVWTKRKLLKEISLPKIKS